MPQLDSITFFMQVFFTFLSFWMSFSYFTLLVLPEIYVATKQRQIITNFMIKIGLIIKLH
jgi:hypothetical protein